MEEKTLQQILVFAIVALLYYLMECRSSGVEGMEAEGDGAKNFASGWNTPNPGPSRPYSVKLLDKDIAAGLDSRGEYIRNENVLQSEPSLVLNLGGFRRGGSYPHGNLGKTWKHQTINRSPFPEMAVVRDSFPEGHAIKVEVADDHSSTTFQQKFNMSLGI